MAETGQLRPLVTSRIPGSKPMAAVLAGDIAVLFAFVATGQATHGYFFWELPVHTVLITIPLLIAWLAVAVPAGLFVRDRLRQYKWTIPVVIVAWIGASLLGGAIRATPLFPGGAPIGFLAANIAFGILFFVPWRVFVTWQLRRLGL